MMLRKFLAMLLLAAVFAGAGCSSRSQIRYGDKAPSKAEAFEATLKAFEDCGLSPRANRADLTLESHWDWLGIGTTSHVLLFPLSWAQFRAEIRDDRVDLEGDAYGLNWLGLWMNLPVGFPLGGVEDRMRARLGEIPAR